MHIHVCLWCVVSCTCHSELRFKWNTLYLDIIEKIKDAVALTENGVLLVFKRGEKKEKKTVKVKHNLQLKSIFSNNFRRARNRELTKLTP